MTYRLKKTRRLKPKHSFWRNKSLWVGVLLLCTAGAAAYLIFISPYFQVTDVRILGNQEVKTEELQKFVSDRISHNVFLFKTKSIVLVSPAKLRAELLQSFPRLAEASFSRRLPGMIILNIQERKPAAVWCHQESEGTDFLRCFFIDSNGVAFQGVDVENRATFPLLRDRYSNETPRLGSAVIQRDTLEKVLALENELIGALHIEAKEAILLPENRVNIVTQGSWVIYFELPLELSWQITRLKLLLAKEIPVERRPELEYIDMRYSKVYYRYRGSE
ncbi:MAG: hypothetical protein A2667_03160 [Candidatus Wildermuthbacteria bacterium RIFCSPHIGHO2_01_FULL_47_27]|uniref:Uncharacterized protein n=2 Tax=Candidatus Wildermuthiibacteriota TaxID=1817923 RepID=A0A1G2RMY4_9BACT|nr:MAG: hypothetical protein UY15_C0026G0004 [Parcubacteria group bacterium GW2011_GWA2_47_9]OHA63429.1 MAG: hypothetical protein A2667_03160 [Candidatus Wildermuthbacteria bacterium RIFCSPHIGHO2_01_FULL_47_27]OHA66956.1 MAG: hypothetical protein A3D59_01885 [Candidatus Wildermuthbacteria bacterium RIFCSPHIGHO2_02_FULL_47_17]OHA73858.1 MAG: hypothetical protein A3A32_02995 [Candidatus Wildermuthbacteria bacterium RIFCSPLOWO2_01_FULL_48_35]OHA76543.1 MAG: hypothetical protein A3I38_03675 [Candid